MNSLSSEKLPRNSVPVLPLNHHVLPNRRQRPRSIGPRHSLWFLAILVCGLATPETRAENLTQTGRQKRDLVFTDAETLTFVEQITARQLAILELKIGTGKTTRLHPDLTNNEFEPCFALDGKHYAFLQNVGNLNLRLVIRNQETGKEAEFRQGGFSGMRSPCFTPDSAHLLYAYPEEGRQHIWKCDLKCEKRIRLIDSSGSNNWPRVTPDGSTIIFGSTRDGNFELYSAAIDGSNVRRLTENPRQDIRPAISADGRHLAFTSNRDGNYEIYVMDLVTGRKRRVTTNPERDDFPAWHPDGRIAYVAEEDGRFDIRLISITD